MTIKTRRDAVEAEWAQKYQAIIRKNPVGCAVCGAQHPEYDTGRVRVLIKCWFCYAEEHDVERHPVME